MKSFAATLRRLREHLRGSLFVVAMLSALTVGAFAQDAGFGTISGTVTDQSHNVVGNATVTIVQTDTGIKRDVQTTSTGGYSAAFLKPGRYEVFVSATGFARVNRKDINIPVGQILTIDIELPVASTESTVTITGDAPLIDTEKIGTSQEIGQALLSSLPINARRFDNIVLMTPNVAPDGTSGLIAYRGVSGLYNTNLIDGANNNQAFFSEARGRAIGAPYVYSTDSIQEFQSAASSYGAEFGQAAGGQINAVSKSGTNGFHGDLFYYLRYPDLNALDPYGKAHGLFTQPVHQQHQFGGSVGGPIIRDKLFFFFTYDGFRKVNPIVYLSNFTGFNNFACPVQLTAAQCQAALDYASGKSAGMYGYHNQGIFPRLVTQDIYFPKLDWQLNQKNHISAEFNWQNFKEPHGYNTSNTVTNGGVTQNGSAAFHERFGILNWTSVLGPSSVNQVVFQGSRDFETASTNTGGPAVSISGVMNYGETSALPRGAFPDEHRWQIADIYSKTQGRHDLKFGLDFSFIHEYLANLFQGDGSYSYSADAAPADNLRDWMLDVYGVNTGDVLAGRHYRTFTQVNDPITHIGADDFWNKNLSLFAQDRFKITPKLQISAGLRWDAQLVPQPPKPNTSSNLANLYSKTIHIGYDGFQPRLGFSYQGWKNGVIRGGYGMFVGLSSNSTYYTMRVENGVYQQQYNVSRSSSKTAPYPTWAPQYTNVLFTPPGPALAAPFTGALTPQVVNTGAALTPLAIRGLDPDYSNPYSHSYDLGIEQELPYHVALTVGYVGNHAARLPVFIDTNVKPATQTKSYDVVDKTGKTLSVVTLPWYTQRVTYDTANILTGFSNIDSWYNSMVITVKKPMSHGIELLGNYTYSHATDGGQVSGVNGTFNGTDTPVDPFNLGAEYGRSDLDMRTRVTGSFIFSPIIRTDNTLVKTVANGWSLSGAYTAQSGNPVTGFMSNSPPSGLGVGDPANTKGVAGNGGLTGAALSLFNSATGARAPQVPRNAFPGPGVHNLDARISRLFSIHESMGLQIFAEAFNVANHPNVISVNTNYSSYVASGGTGCSAALHTNGCIVPYTAVTFGSPSSTSSTIFGARQMQFTAKFIF